MALLEKDEVNEKEDYIYKKVCPKMDTIEHDSSF